MAWRDPDPFVRRHLRRIAHHVFQMIWPEYGYLDGAQQLQDFRSDTPASKKGSYPKSVISVRPAAAAGRSSDRWRR